MSPVYVFYRYASASWRCDTPATPWKLVYCGTLEECQEFYWSFSAAFLCGGLEFRRPNGKRMRRPSFAAVMREVEAFYGL